MVPSEASEQMALVRWLRRRKLVFCHVPNGGLRRKSEARKLKAMGTQAGVPDILVFSPPPVGNFVGAAIELKRIGGGRVTAHQKEWMERLEACGWATFVASGHTEAEDWLCSLGYTTPH